MVCLLYFHLYNAKKLYAFAWFVLFFFSEYFAKRNTLVRALNFSLFKVLNIIYMYIYIYRRKYMYRRICHSVFSAYDQRQIKMEVLVPYTSIIGYNFSVSI